MTLTRLPTPSSPRQRGELADAAKPALRRIGTHPVLVAPRQQTVGWVASLRATELLR